MRTPIAARISTTMPRPVAHLCLSLTSEYFDAQVHISPSQLSNVSGSSSNHAQLGQRRHEILGQRHHLILCRAVKGKEIAASRTTDIVDAAAPVDARDLSPAVVTTVAEGSAAHEAPVIGKSAESLAWDTFVVGTVLVPVPVALAGDE